MYVKVSSSSIVSPLHASSIIVGDDGDDVDDTTFDESVEILVSFIPSFIIRYFLSVLIFALPEIPILAF